MINRALIIAPHPDDEINLAGQLIIKLIRLNIEVFILYTTNGDSDKKIGNQRIYEAIRANKVLGVDRKHIIFLGYANEWRGEKHIYNAESQMQLISKLGKTNTNSIKELPEYCFLKHGIHHKFTRKNFKNDFSEVIEDILPDLIVCPEFDSHPDHRATALITDEILGELFKKNSQYRPILLKKYIHEGVWNGPKDYHSIPIKPTQTSGPRFYSGGMHDLDSPNFRWNDRISYQVEKDTTSELLKNNIIYKAAKQHKLTTAWYEMQRVINGDMVYWLRPTWNLALTADIEGSSGDTSYINDFKHFDTHDVKKIQEPFYGANNYCWKPKTDDKQKKLVLKFKKSEIIKCIFLYEDCNAINHIKKLRIEIGTNYKYDLELKKDGTKTELLIEQYLLTDCIIFQILEWEGEPGIAEIEIYSKTKEFSKSLPLDLYYPPKSPFKKSILQTFEYFYFLCLFLFKFKIQYEINKLLSIKYIR